MIWQRKKLVAENQENKNRFLKQQLELQRTKQHVFIFKNNFLIVLFSKSKNRNLTISPTSLFSSQEGYPQSINNRNDFDLMGVYFKELQK